MTEVLSFPLTAMLAALVAILFVPAERRLLAGLSAAAAVLPGLALVHAALTGRLAGALAAAATPGGGAGAAGGVWPIAGGCELTPLTAVLIGLHGLVFLAAALATPPAPAPARAHHALLVVLTLADLGALTSANAVTFSTWLLTAMVALGYFAVQSAPAHRRDGLVATSTSLALGALLLLFGTLADPPGGGAAPRWVAIVVLAGLALVAPIFPLHVWVKRGLEEARGPAALLLAWLPTTLAAYGGGRWYVTEITSAVPGWLPVLGTLLGASALAAALTLRARAGGAPAMAATSHVYGSLALLGALAGGAVGARALPLVLAAHALTLPLLSGEGRRGAAWTFACRAAAAGLPFTAFFPGLLLLFMGILPAAARTPGLGAGAVMALAGWALLATFHLQRASAPAEPAPEGATPETWYPLAVLLWLAGLALGTAPSIGLAWMGSPLP